MIEKGRTSASDLRKGRGATQPQITEMKIEKQEFQNLLKMTQIFLNFLYDIRNILPEINITFPCSFPPAVSQTGWDLTIGFYGKYLTFISNLLLIDTSKLFDELLKNLIDMLMTYLYLHHVTK